MTPDEFDAGIYKLAEIKELITWIEEWFGEDAILNFNAGANNICLEVYRNVR